MTKMLRLPPKAQMRKTQSLPKRAQIIKMHPDISTIRKSLQF